MDMQHLIKMALQLVALLSQYPLTDHTTPIFSESILCSFLATCTGTPFLTLLLTTAHLCSISRTINVLLDSPMYIHSITILAGTWYVIPFSFSSGTRNFTLISTCLKVSVLSALLITAPLLFSRRRCTSFRI